MPCHVDMGDGRQDERVRGVEQLRQLLLDLRVESRIAEQPRPTGVCPPPPDLNVDGVHDLGVEIEAEIIARREVGQPMVTDSDPPPVDLVDDGVVHRVPGA